MNPLKRLRRSLTASGKRSNRRRTTAFEFLEERCCPSTVDIWLGGTGNYSNAANWSLGVVPNNGNSRTTDRPTTFTVEIANSSAVTLDINPTIDNLTIDATSSLSIPNGQSLTVVRVRVHDRDDRQQRHDRAGGDAATTPLSRLPATSA